MVGLGWFVTLAVVCLSFVAAEGSDEVTPQPSHYKQHMQRLLQVSDASELTRAMHAAAREAQTQAELVAASGEARSEYVKWRLGRGRTLEVINGGSSLSAIQSPGLNSAPSEADMNITIVRYSMALADSVVDWRTSTAVLTPVLDQGPCESCWVTAGTDIIAMHWALSFHLLTPIPLSPQHVCDCAFSGRCCMGGWPEWTFLFSLFNKGIAPLSLYPYLGANGNTPSPLAWKQRCKGGSTALSGSITGWEKLPAADPVALRSTVAQFPVLALLSVPRSFLVYSGGIWHGTDCSRYPTVNHAVILMGFNATGPEPYWIAKNTWGQGWGEGGYIRISMNGTVCGLGSEPSFYPTLFKVRTPCDATPDPCGVGTCFLMPDLKSARCKCPPGFVERIESSSPKCVSDSPCAVAINPCAFGTCNNEFDGSYTCACPPGTLIGSRADGGETCIVNSFQSGLSTYTTLPGDTCDSLMGTFGLTSDLLATMNPFLNCSGPFLPGTLVVLAGLEHGAGCSSNDVVQPGDTCDSLASRNDISTAQLQLVNPALSCSALLVSQHVCVSPGKLDTSSPYERSCGSTWDTEFGDTCLSVTQNAGVTLDMLEWLNPGIDCSQALPANTICVSPLVLGLASVTCSVHYTLTHGDTCFTVADAAGLTVKAFLDLNPGMRCYWPNWVVGLSVCIKGTTTPLSEVESPPNFVPYYVSTNSTLTSIAVSFSGKCDNAPDPGNATAVTSFVNDICMANGWYPDCSDRWVVVGAMVLVPCLHNIGATSCETSDPGGSTFMCGSDMVTYANYACAAAAFATPIYSYTPCLACQNYCLGIGGVTISGFWGFTPAGCNGGYVCPTPTAPSVAYASQICTPVAGSNAYCQVVQLQCAQATNRLSFSVGCPVFRSCMSSKGCPTTVSSPCGQSTYTLGACS